MITENEIYEILNKTFLSTTVIMRKDAMENINQMLVCMANAVFKELQDRFDSIKYLDRDKVEEIITDNEIWKMACVYSGNDDYRNKDLSEGLHEILDKICSLAIPEINTTLTCVYGKGCRVDKDRIIEVLDKCVDDHYRELHPLEKIYNEIIGKE